MANKHLLRNSHKVRNQPDAWWYEEPKGISVVVNWRAIKTTGATIDIPWKSIRAALARKDKK